MRIVTDSSANIVDYKDMNLGVAPLHIIVGDMDYVDDDMVDIDAMQKKLSSYKGKTSTASPSPEEWERAFGNDDIIFCITITSGLSGTYNSALAAKGKYESEHKGSRVFIIDSLSTGPEIELIAEKAQELHLMKFITDLLNIKRRHICIFHWHRSKILQKTEELTP